jgi:hypothetical protein
MFVDSCLSFSFQTFGHYIVCPIWGRRGHMVLLSRSEQSGNLSNQKTCKKNEKDEFSTGSKVKWE